jgi:Flp pilus assembly pilin Flp
MFGRISKSAGKQETAEAISTEVATTARSGKFSTVLRRVRELAQNTRGAEMVEMIVIVAIVISLVYAGMKVFGSQVSTALSKQGSAVSQIGNGS